MKIRKTRILKQTKANGGEVFWPQYKGFLWMWYCMADFECFGYAGKFSEYMLKNGLEHNKPQKTLEEAQLIIDKYLQFVNHHNACKIENKVVEEQVIKYP